MIGYKSFSGRLSNQNDKIKKIFSLIFLNISNNSRATSGLTTYLISGWS